jgi:putative ABC transport system permease protein
MVQSYFKIALRVLWKNKGQTIINISGLGFSIGCCLLIILFVKNEFTFDTFHTKANRIFRAWFKYDNGNGNISFQTTTPFPLGKALEGHFEEVESVVRLISISPWVKVHNDQYADQVTFVSKDFFHVFDFSGPSRHRIDLPIQPNDAILTSDKALKYFGKKDPVNQTISIQIGEEFYDFIVRNVVKNPPSNSSIQFEVLISDENLQKLYKQKMLESEWFKGFPETYVLLKEGTKATDFIEKIPMLFSTFLNADFNGRYDVGLQPLTNIHLNRDFPPSFTPVGDPRYSYILSGIALVILFMASINFVTMSIGVSLSRSKEVGVRKVIGAERLQLIGQFIGEAFLITFLSLTIGILIAKLALPIFNDLSGRKLVMQADGVILISGFLLLCSIGLFAGSYPAFILSGFKPISVLKQNVQTNSKQNLRRVLVALQLVIAIFLIASTMTMRQQLQYLQHKDKGFNAAQLVALELDAPRTGNLADVINRGFEKATQFKDQLSQFHDLEVSIASHVFGVGKWTTVGFTDNHGNYSTFNLNFVEESFIPTLKINMVDGRNFSDAISTDAERAIIVNEAFVKSYGLTNALGKRLPSARFFDHEIIGIVRDFNYAPLYDKIEPLVLTMNPLIPLSGMENITINSSPIPKLIIRLPAKNAGESLDNIKSTWGKLSPSKEFSMEYVEDKLNAQYQNDQNLSRIVKIASLIAMFIAGLGLYALALLSMKSRVKEISIRKVLGASESYLILFLSRSYIYLILVSVILSAPFTYYVMQKWLQSFEYRISIDWKVFALTGLSAILVGIFVIGYHTIRLARTQPAETLKSDN